MSLFGKKETKEIEITIDQKVLNTFGGRYFIYTKEYPYELFDAATILLWFKLKIGQIYKVEIEKSPSYDYTVIRKIV